MPVTLLPASAAAFAPRSSPNVVLNSKVEPWLTATLKRINRIKRPLNSAPQHQRCLTETLSLPSAIWTLCSIMLPKAPDSRLRRDDNPLVEALFNYQLLHIEAYVVHVDMVSQNEVAFKLTQDTIDSLVEYHKDIFSVDTSAATWNWSDKEVQLKKLQDDFVQAANRFVFRTISTALEGLEDDGAGELLQGGADEVKNQIMGLFHPLLPPPPRVETVVRPPPILPSSTGSLGSSPSLSNPTGAGSAASNSSWWPPTMMSPPATLPSQHHHHQQQQQQFHQQQHQPPPQQHTPEPWNVLPSSPLSVASSVDSCATPNMWSAVPVSMPSSTPAPSSSSTISNASTASVSSSTTVVPTVAPVAAPFCLGEIDISSPATAPATYYMQDFFDPSPVACCAPPLSMCSAATALASTSMLPMPSVLAQQCSTSAGFGGYGIGLGSIGAHTSGFAWDKYGEYTAAAPYATI